MTRSGGPERSLPISPLSGKLVVNTRSPRQAPELDELLAGRGAIPASYPCIDIAPPRDQAALERALGKLSSGAYDWLVFTSSNAVAAVAAAAAGVLGRGGSAALSSEIGQTRVAVVGPGTAAAVRRLLGLSVDLEPRVHTAEALAEELVARQVRKALIPAAERARDVLSGTLAMNGAEAEVVTAYRTVLGQGGADLPELLRTGRVDAVIFTSPSTIENLALRLERENGDWSCLNATCIACIGPVTVQAATRRGLRVDVAPRDHSIGGLVEALETYFGTSVRLSDQGGCSHV